VAAPCSGTNFLLIDWNKAKHPSSSDTTGSGDGKAGWLVHWWYWSPLQLQSHVLFFITVKCTVVYQFVIHARASLIVVSKPVSRNSVVIVSRICLLQVSVVSWNPVLYVFVALDCYKYAALCTFLIICLYVKCCCLQCNLNVRYVAVWWQLICI